MNERDYWERHLWERRLQEYERRLDLAALHHVCRGFSFGFALFFGIPIAICIVRDIVSWLSSR